MSESWSLRNSPKPGSTNKQKRPETVTMSEVRISTVKTVSIAALWLDLFFTNTTSGISHNSLTTAVFHAHFPDKETEPNRNSIICLRLCIPYEEGHRPKFWLVLFRNSCYCVLSALPSACGFCLPCYWLKISYLLLNIISYILEGTGCPVTLRKEIIRLSLC